MELFLDVEHGGGKKAMKCIDANDSSCENLISNNLNVTQVFGKARSPCLSLSYRGNSEEFLLC